MCCHALLQGILSTQESNPVSYIYLHWQVGSLPQYHLGSPVKQLCPNLKKEKLLNISMARPGRALQWPQRRAGLCLGAAGGGWLAVSKIMHRNNCRPDGGSSKVRLPRAFRAEKAPAFSCGGAAHGAFGFGCGPGRTVDIFKVHNLLFSIIAEATCVQKKKIEETRIHQRKCNPFIIPFPRNNHWGTFPR